MTGKIEENILLANSHFKKQKEYWMGKLTGELLPTEIPGDKNDLLPQHDMHQTDIFLSGNLSQQLIKLCKTSDLSLYIFMLTSVKWLIYRYTNNEDICVLSPLYQSKVSDKTLNHCLIIRDMIPGHAAFCECLFQVRQSVLQAYENQDYPFEKLMEFLLVGDSSSAPHQVVPIQVSCSFKNIHAEKYIHVLGGKLSFIFWREQGQVKGNLLYDNHIYSESFADQLQAHLAKIVECSLGNLNTKVVDILLLSEEEKKRLIFDFNWTATGYHGNKTIQQLFAEQVEQTPCQIALIGQMPKGAAPDVSFKQHFNAIGDDVSLTYKKLNEIADRLAYLLREKGVRPDTIVAIMVGRSVEMIASLLAIIKAGGAYLPIEPGYPGERINYMLTDSSAKILLTTHDLSEKCEKMSNANCQLFMVNEKPLPHRSFNIPPQEPASHQHLQLPPLTSLAYIIYTSGSTGKPKAVMVEHKGVSGLVKETNYMNWLPGERLLLTGAFVFDITTFEIWGPLLNGLTLVLQEQDRILDVKQLEEILSRNYITILHLIPQLFNQLIEQDLGVLNGLDYFLVGGDMVHPYYINKVRRGNKRTRILHMYGPTENTTFSTFFLVEQDFQGTIPIGRPVSGTVLYIVDKYDNLVPIGVPGELLVGGSGLARGYLNQPELTSGKFEHELHELTRIRTTSNKKFLQGSPGGAVFSKSAPPGRRRQKLYETGDLARWMWDGNIEFLGRRDYQVKIRGSRVELGEIENQLLAHEGIKEAVVIDREKISPAGAGGNEEKYLCAYFVPRHQGSFDETLSISSFLQKYLSESLPAFMIPAYFVPLAEMPLTPNGKIDKKALPEPDLKAEQGYTAPRNQLEEKLIDIWSEVLGLKKNIIGIHDSFLKLGGHSLKATILASKIHKEFNIKIPIAKVFQLQTIEGLAKYIIAAGAAQQETSIENNYASIDSLEKKDYYVLTSPQERMYFLQQMDTDSTNYNIFQMVELIGSPNRERLEDTFKKLIKRHETLRTSFASLAGQPVQRVCEPLEVEFKIEYYTLSVEKGDGHRGADTRSEEIVKIVRQFVRPFDLTCPPLFRVGFIRTSRPVDMFLVDIHHIISDETSHKVLTENYKALSQGEELPPLRIQYKDYAQWQKLPEQKDNTKQQEIYWLKEFAGEIPELNLKTDYERAGGQNFEGRMVSGMIKKDKVEGLRALEKEENVTMFMIILTLFNVFLYKLSGQKDITVGTAAAARQHADLEEMIGMIANTIVMKNSVHEDITFRKLLEHVKNRALQAFANQDYPFDELVNKVVKKRAVNRNPLFDVFLSFFAYKDEERILDSTSFEEKIDFNIPVKFDLAMTLTEFKETMIFNFSYRSDLFKSETIERFIEYFKDIISAVVKEPGIYLKNITLTSDLAAAKPGMALEDEMDFGFSVMKSNP
ncbi:MAG: amino acid adenylation domain-containing protein [Candidatus Aminicenantes bacterium]